MPRHSERGPWRADGETYTNPSGLIPAKRSVGFFFPSDCFAPEGSTVRSVGNRGCTTTLKPAPGRPLNKPPPAVAIVSGRKKAIRERNHLESSCWWIDSVSKHSRQHWKTLAGLHYFTELLAYFQTLNKRFKKKKKKAITFSLQLQY